MRRVPEGEGGKTFRPWFKLTYPQGQVGHVINECGKAVQTEVKQNAKLPQASGQPSCGGLAHPLPRALHGTDTHFPLPAQGSMYTLV